MFNPQNVEMLELNRQRRMADLLTSQGMQTPQGQTVSGGIYVPPNPMEYLAKLYSTYQGTKANRELDTKELALAKALRDQQQQMGQDYFEAISPTQTELAGPTPTGAPLSTVNQADYRKAFGIATDPTAPSWLKAQAAEMLKPQKLSEGDIIQRLNLSTGKMETAGQGAPKTPEKIQTAAIVLGLDSKPRSEWTAQDRAMIDAQIQKTQQSGAMNLGQKGFDNTLKLRGDFRSEPVYKGFQEIESAYSQINAGLNSKSPAGDLAAATKFMKLLDPTSVVRESELSMAMKATGALDRLYNYANLVATGQKLTPTQREDFRKLGNEFYTTSYNQYNTKRKEYSDIAERNQLNVDDVVGKMPKPPVVSQPPMFATNPTTGERIQSTDGGNNWKPVPKGK
jgi:hypothetical protein